MVNLKIHNPIEISSHIPVENYVKEKEELIVLIYVLNCAIVENASLVSMRAQLSNVIVGRHKEWLDVVNKEQSFNVVKNVKNY